LVANCTTLCFGLNLDEQQQSRFVYDYSIYQVEYSRNLIFASGAVMTASSTRSSIAPARGWTSRRCAPCPAAKAGRTANLASICRLAKRVVIEEPRWNLTIFKVRFGLLTLKGYTKGERVLRFEAIVHNTKQLGLGRTLDKFAQITSRLTGMVDRFTSMLDCLHPVVSRHLALITVTGRRSGQDYTLPVGYRRVGERVTVPVGWPARKLWWRNLQGGARVRLRLGSEQHSGLAEVRGDERSGVLVEVQLDP
jgi:hypothetical protein